MRSTGCEFHSRSIIILLKNLITVGCIALSDLDIVAGDVAVKLFVDSAVEVSGVINWLSLCETNKSCGYQFRGLLLNGFFS